jgi:hypothetical protein
MADIERMLCDVVARHEGAPETWDALTREERARMLAYVEQGWVLNPRRHRAEEVAFWLSLGRGGAAQWLRRTPAQTVDYERWLRTESNPALARSGA